MNSSLSGDFIFWVKSLLRNVLLRNERLSEPPSSIESETIPDGAALPPVILHYEDSVKLILSWFNGRTLEEQGPCELLEKCREAA